MNNSIEDIINIATDNATKELNDELNKLRNEMRVKEEDELNKMSNEDKEDKPKKLRKKRAIETKPRITRSSKYEGINTAERRKKIKKEHYKTKGKIKYAKISRCKRHDLNMEDFVNCNTIIEVNEKVVSLLKERGYDDKLIKQVIRTRNTEYKPYKKKENTDNNSINSNNNLINTDNKV